MTRKRSYLGIERYFTKDERDPYKSVDWTKADVTITDENGELLFIQPGVEMPSTWSPLTRQIVASRYFYGENGTPSRESSIRQVVSRVSETFEAWASKQKYFATSEELAAFKDDLAYITLNQMMSFNSPVWFNAGVDKYMIKKADKKHKRNSFIINRRTGKAMPLPAGMEYAYPQTSACFIQGVEDTMESIMGLAVNEAMLFKYGSGTGTDLSTLRSSREKLSGGGKPSGPMAYLTFYDRVAGIVKSGGKTRRAAKMNSNKAEHPDIKEFIVAKAEEQRKLEGLMDYLGLSFKEAETTVAFQNVNFSVRATDNFMHSVEADKDWQTIPVHSKDMADQMPKYKARELMRLMAEGIYKCGDPGIQFHDTINKWHTCPNSAPIKASNPCSEFMFIDNSSCNLASHNLMKYINENGAFDVEKFARAARATVIAMDLEIDNSSFPTKEIAENSHKFRPLGMGYSNLGTLLMYLGLPYDSDEGRNTAAAITALLTGKVYETSTEMAEKLGPFKEFEKNREPMLHVIGMHRDALKGIDRGKLPKGLEAVLDEAERTWDNVVTRGTKYGFRNSQASVLAPTGTISFMMGCDTFGIEPEVSLIKKKRLAEGGILKIVNKMVPHALNRLGYNPDEIKRILDYTEKNGTIEGSELKTEHLPVFDCSYKGTDGKIKRIIHYMGHLKMMAAVQPFVSGAISKTVAFPHEATVEEIEKSYMDAWKMGIKAIAPYRDGSKRCQPLTVGETIGHSAEILEKKVLDYETQIEKLEEQLDKARTTPVRRKLPITTNSVRHKFNIADHEGYLHIGLYPDGKPGEIFINMSKEGSTMGGMADAFATALSICMQYNVPLEDIVKKFKHQKFDPRGLVHEGHPEIHTTTSIVDYVSTFMEKLFMQKAENGDADASNDDNGDNPTPEIKKIEPKHAEKKVNDNKYGEELGGFCTECGSQRIKKGHCEEVCPNCNAVSTSGCGG